MNEYEFKKNFNKQDVSTPEMSDLISEDNILNLKKMRSQILLSEKEHISNNKDILFKSQLDRNNLKKYPLKDRLNYFKGKPQKSNLLFFLIL